MSVDLVFMVYNYTYLYGEMQANFLECEDFFQSRFRLVRLIASAKGACPVDLCAKKLIWNPWEQNARLENVSS